MYAYTQCKYNIHNVYTCTYTCTHTIHVRVHTMYIYVLLYKFTNSCIFTIRQTCDVYCNNIPQASGANFKIPIVR